MTNFFVVQKAKLESQQASLFSAYIWYIINVLKHVQSFSINHKNVHNIDAVPIYTGIYINTYIYIYMYRYCI